MQNDADHINIEFHSKAKQAFFQFIEQFQSSVKNIDRTNHEYQFQQLKEKFANSFKQQLEIIAGQLIKSSSDLKNINEVNQNLQRFINNYLHEFVQKIKHS
jgi:hypothetical protein